MKLLIVADFYYPGYKAGGPIQSIFNLACSLSSHYDIYIVTRDRDSGDKRHYEGVVPNAWNDLDTHKVYYMSPEYISPRNIGSIIQEIAPDIIYLNSFFSTYTVCTLLYCAMKDRNRKILLAPRGEFNEAALSIKKYKKAIYLQFFNLFLKKMLNINWQATNQKEFGFIKERVGAKVAVYEIENFGKTKQLPLRGIDKAPGKLRILTVARVHPIKNLHFFARVLREFTAKHPAEITWDVYGLAENAEYMQQVKDELMPARNVSLHFKGDVPNFEIQAISMDYHLFVLPTLGENFGHAIYEAILSGLPVLVSNTTPWTGLEKFNIGFDLPLDMPQMWEEKLQYFLGLNASDLHQLRITSYEYGKRKIAGSKTAEKFMATLNAIAV